MSGIQEISESASLVLPGSMTNSVKNYINSIQAVVIKAHSRMEVWVTPPGSEPQPSEVLAKGKENWREKGHNFHHQLGP